MISATASSSPAKRERHLPLAELFAQLIFGDAAQVIFQAVVNAIHVVVVRLHLPGGLHVAALVGGPKAGEHALTLVVHPQDFARGVRQGERGRLQRVFAEERFLAGSDLFPEFRRFTDEEPRRPGDERDGGEHQQAQQDVEASMEIRDLTRDRHGQSVHPGGQRAEHGEDDRHSESLDQ